MTMIGVGPVFDLMREHAARQKAREDWAYRDEMRKLEGRAADEIERLRSVLEDIAVRGKIITNGDCGVLRDHARRALGLEPLDT